MENQAGSPTLGVLNIIAGVIFGLGGVSVALASSSNVAVAGWREACVLGGISVVRAMLGSVSVIGGVCSLRGRGWGLALTGAVLNLVLLIGTIWVMFTWGTPMLFFTGWVPLPVDLVVILALFGMSITAISLAVARKNRFDGEYSSRSLVLGTLAFSVGVGLLLSGFVAIAVLPAIMMDYGIHNGLNVALSVLVIVLGVLAVSGGIRFFRKRD